MPLSEHEQRVLEELERTLLADDPEFVDTLRTEHRRRPVGAFALGALGVLAGLGLLVLGVALAQVWIGVGGFVVMFAAVVGASALASRVGEDAEQAVETAHPADLNDVFQDFKPRPNRARAASGQGNRTRAESSSFMTKLEDRWDRRQDGR